MKPVREVRTDHCDDQNIVHIDVYFTEDDNEEGVVAGFIDLDTGKIIYVDALLMDDPAVKEAVDEVLATRLNDNVLLIELPDDHIKFNTEQDFNEHKKGINFYNTPFKFPCIGLYVKTELNPNGKDEEIYEYLYPVKYDN